MGKGEGLSIGDLHESLREKAGKVLVIMAGVALATSGCAVPTPCNAEQQEQENPTADTQTDSEGNPDLDWKIVDVGCRQDNCETGESPGDSVIARACDGTTLLYRYYEPYKGGLTAIPNSPECGYIPPTAENSPAPTAEATPTPANGN